MRQIPVLGNINYKKEALLKKSNTSSTLSLQRPDKQASVSRLERDDEYLAMFFGGGGMNGNIEL